MHSRERLDLAARIRSDSGAVRPVASPRSLRPAACAAQEVETSARPLSLVQMRFWTLDQSGRAGAAHHVGRALRLTGPLDVAALGQALREVARRHDLLRASFVGLEGKGPLQRITP